MLPDPRHELFAQLLAAGFDPDGVALAFLPPQGSC
jgi:hypothetical protein